MVERGDSLLLGKFNWQQQKLNLFRYGEQKRHFISFKKMPSLNWASFAYFQFPSFLECVACFATPDTYILVNLKK